MAESKTYIESGSVEELSETNDLPLRQRLSADQLDVRKNLSQKPIPYSDPTQRQNLQLWRESGLRIFGILCTVLFFLILVSLILFIAFYPWFEKNIAWDKTTQKGPLWYAVIPQVTVFLGALAGGALWVINWFQKQATIDTQRDALQETQRQFEENRKKDQHQFQRRLLEERFNRILDDFAKEDPASRAGAASRLASIAKELSPEVEPGAAISEDNNPFYIPAVRQLAQRMVLEENKQVGAAIQDALEEISSWTKQEAESAINRPVARAEIDKTQAQLIHILAETNRSALAAWLDAFAGFLIAKKVFPTEDSVLEFADNLMEQISKDQKLLPSIKNRANWCYKEETYKQAIHDLICLSDFRTSYRRRREDQDESADSKDFTNGLFALATQRLLFARDTLAIGLRHLPVPADLPDSGKDALQLATAFRSWERVSWLSLSGVFLQGANLGYAQMQGAHLYGAKMQGANLREAQMQGAKLNEALIQGADLTRVQMQGADLAWAKIQGACLYQAEMQSADLRDTQLQGTDLRKAQMQGADLQQAQMQGADLKRAELQKADLRHAAMQGADLKRAQMQRADLCQAHLQGADLYQARIQRVDLRHAEMQGANLRRTLVQGANLASTNNLPTNALCSEYQASEWDEDQGQWVVPERTLNEDEQTHYDSVVRKLIKQGDLTEEVGNKLIGKSPIGEGAVTYEMVMAELKTAESKVEKQEPVQAVEDSP